MVQKWQRNQGRQKVSRKCLIDFAANLSNFVLMMQANRNSISSSDTNLRKMEAYIDSLLRTADWMMSVNMLVGWKTGSLELDSLWKVCIK